jgi:hypothetical protein
MYRFQHRYVPGFQAPLKPGKYQAVSDFYHVERSPRVGETCEAYIAHAKQCGTLVKTTRENYVVE